MFGVNLILNESNDFTKIGIGLKKEDKYQKIISVEEKKIEKILLKNIPNIYSIIPKMTFLFKSTSEERRNF